MNEKLNLSEELERLEINFKRRIRNTFPEMQHIDAAELNKDKLMAVMESEESDRFVGIKSWLQSLLHKSEI